ncbi:MAG TPA: SDR family NAD(P)-dependent oxidoreductase [Acidimicrobiales bacterium]|nr:SDR family NAD(P)-dependent oxidoreductase [Acidimicrobiales bacterium]
MNDAMGMPQSAVVLGGTSEIARAVLRALVARRLTRVVLAGRDQGSLQVSAKELEALGAEVHCAPFDVTDVAGHGSFAAECAARVGQVDLVLVAAGVLGDQEADAIDPARTAHVLETNCTGPAAAMTAFAEVLRRQGHGRIVVLSSVAGVRVRKANYVYGASKAGLDAFAQGMSDALEGTGVSVVIVRPGWVATRMTEGREPAPFATTPDSVAADLVTGLERGAAVVWSPAVLRIVFGVMRQLPAALWRRMPG